MLVTGAGGFIGSHLAERLVELNARTRAFVRYNAQGSWGWLDSSVYRTSMEVVAGDITDRDSIRDAMRGVDVVFHLAALISIPYSYHAPVSYLRTNVEGTLNVVQAARELGIARVVHTSTSEVYGSARYFPIDEQHPLQGQSPYSASKMGADKIAEAFQLSYQVPIVTVRPFNTFGPRQSARAVLPAIITQCLTGDTVRLGSLTPSRDWSYVENTVDGFLAAGDAPDAIGRTINIGSGREITVRAAAEMIAARIGRTARIEEDEQRVRPAGSEVDRLLADTSLAHSLLGWAPRVSFERGLELTIEWIQANLEKYRPGVYVL